MTAITEQTTSPAKSPASVFMLAIFTGVAILLIVIGYRFEEIAYRSLLGEAGQSHLLERLSLTMSEALALGFSGAKVAAVYVLAYMAAIGKHGVSAWTLRMLLVVLSLFSTLMVVSGNTISPHAESRVVELQNDIRNSHAGLLNSAYVRHQATVDRITTKLEEDEAAATGLHTASVADLNAALDQERKTGIGDRFRALEARLSQEQARYQAVLVSMREAATREIADAEAAYANREGEILEFQKAALDRVKLGEVAQSDESQNGVLVRTAQVLSAMTPDNVQVSTVALTVFFTVLISMGVEFAPLLILRLVFGVMTGPSAQVPRSRPEEDAPTPANRPTALELHDTRKDAA